MKRWLNPEREGWLRENYSRGPIPETVKRFNHLFGAADHRHPDEECER